MSLKSYLSKYLSYFFVKRQNKWIKNALKIQFHTMKNLINESKNTIFGIDHNFNEIKNYEDFKKKNTY